jgi:hypothetical protein
MIELPLLEVYGNRSIATSELVHVASVFFVNTSSNIEILRMLYHVDLIKFSRERNVDEFVFEM